MNAERIIRASEATASALLALTAWTAHATTYYSVLDQTQPWSDFGTINSSGAMTQISSLPMFFSSLLAAPNGTLYAYETTEGNEAHYFGAVSPTTGAFTPLINLNTKFKGTAGFNVPSLAFDSNGDLLAAGIGPSNTGVFGTYNLTTGGISVEGFGTQWRAVLQYGGHEPGASRGDDGNPAKRKNILRGA